MKNITRQDLFKNLLIGLSICLTTSLLAQDFSEVLNPINEDSQNQYIPPNDLSRAIDDYFGTGINQQTAYESQDSGFEYAVQFEQTLTQHANAVDTPKLLPANLIKPGINHQQRMDQIESAPKLGYDANTRIMPSWDMLSPQQREFGFSNQYGHFQQTGFGLSDLARSGFLFETPSAYINVVSGQTYSR